MKEKEKQENNRSEEIEDTTKYGEFVSSYFAWLTLERQKKNAQEMEEMTKQGDCQINRKE